MLFEPVMVNQILNCKLVMMNIKDRNLLIILITRHSKNKKLGELAVSLYVVENHYCHQP